MNNRPLGERGNFTVMGAVFISMIGAWSCLYLQKEMLEFSKLKERLRTFACMKDLNGSVKTHVKIMENLNKVIDASNAALAAGVLSPALLAAAKSAKKAAQAAQQAKHFSHVKKLVGLTRKKCFFNPAVYKTPYRNKLLLTRDNFGRARLRNKKWIQTSLSKQVILKTAVSSKGSETKLRGESLEMPVEALLPK